MKLRLAFLLLLIILMLSGCASKDETTHFRNGLALGTVIQIKLYDDGSEELLDKMFERLASIERRMTINGDASELIDVNNAAGISKVRVSSDTFEVINRSLYFAELSEGKFDATVGPLVKLWGVGTDSAGVPASTEISQALGLIDYRKVRLYPETSEVFLEEKGMMLDLGGIAKGYAADEMVRMLKESGVSKAIINIGGNVFAYGKKSPSSDWKIGIQSPFSENGTSLGTISVSNKTVVSSGIYERYFEENGKLYHHIFDTETGYPVDNDIMQVTVVSSSSIDADALSTIMFSLGIDEGFKLAESLEGVDLIFVTKDKKIYCTKDIKGKINLEDRSFTME